MIRFKNTESGLGLVQDCRPSKSNLDWKRVVDMKVSDPEAAKSVHSNVPRVSCHENLNHIWQYGCSFYVYL